MDSQSSLESAALTFDLKSVAERAALAEQERQAAVNRFPPDQWPTMPLETYAIGHDKSEDSFGRWMEFKTSNIASMKGGQAAKHLIYKPLHKPGWYFDSAYKDVNEAWSALRAGFVEAFAKAQAGDWNTIDDIPVLNGGHALRSKALYCYFPEEILPISSYAHVKRFLQQVAPEAFDSSLGTVRLNRRLMEILRARPCFKGWSNWQIVAFLYHWSDPRESRRIVKIAPGRQAEYWDDCLAGEYICVGWDDVGDLDEFESKEDFFLRFKEKYGAGYAAAKLKEKSGEVWTLKELEPGDLIVANKGTSEILAVGEVVEPGYEFRPQRTDFKHTVRVKWNTSLATEIDPPQKRWALVTVAKCPIELYQSIVRKSVKPPPIPVDPFHSEIAAALERKGQVILYGPPGTGKTRAALQVAVWWLLRNRGLSEAQAVLADPKKFAEAERSLTTVQVTQRVWWVNASPKVWSWDRLRKEKKVEFDLGRLERNFPLVQPGDLVIGYQSTPDKCVKALARVSRGLAKNETGEPGIELSYLHDVESGLTYDELLADPVLAKSEPRRFRDQGTLFALERDEANHVLSRLTDRDQDVAEYLDTNGRVGQLTRLTFHASYSYEDFIEGFRPVESSGGLVLRLEDGVFKRICREAQANPDRPYLVLIDEFNRANVAKVFGELITLLELDKRELIITLPQSKESFSIPRNVFILGTMNTADRSIKLLDSAMRRRFAFIELMPDTETLRGGNVGGLELEEFLTRLNSRIAKHAGREKQIGHSFLLERGQPVTEPEEFARRFRQEILPLLQEYCYDDYSALANYLGDNLVDQVAQMLNDEHLGKADLLIAALKQEFAQDAGDDA